MSPSRYRVPITGLALLLSAWVIWIAWSGHNSSRPASTAKAPEANSRIESVQTSPKAPATDQPVVKVSTSPKADQGTQAQVNENYGKLPLSFEANQGHTDAQVTFLSRGSGYNLFLTGTEAVLALRTSGKTARASSADLLETHVEQAQQEVLRMKLVGASATPEIKGVDEQPGKSNYFIGDDPQKWRPNVAHYARVQYTGVYPGVNLVYYGNQRQLDYDLVVAPGIDPNVIKLSFDGLQDLRVNTDGDLILRTAKREIRQHKPIIYQETNGERKEIAGRYKIKGDHEIGFELAAYDTTKPVVIDPVLSYSTYLGGSGDDVGQGIAVDSSGNAYVTGFTTSANFPAVNSLPHGPENAYTFITKLNAAGSALVYSTYVGGMGGAFTLEQGNSIAVDSAGNAYVTGSTSTIDFPTVNAYQTSFHGGGRDAFVLKLSPTGSALVYSTYLGGNADDEGHGIAVDVTGNAYVIGRTVSTDFPTTNALQPVYGGNTCGSSNPCADAFVTKLAPSGSTLIYSTYLGGNGRESGNAIAVDASGSAYVTGFTNSANFPTTANALQRNYSDQGTNSEEHDAFVAKINPSGSAFVYSTYLGGSLGSDDGYGIAVDSVGNAYVAGRTDSRNFPTVNAVQPAIAPGGNGAGSQFSDAFVSKLNATGFALVYSTYLGGGSPDSAQAIALDPAGNAYVTGYAGSGFPIVNPFLTHPNIGGHDSIAFVTKLNPAGSALVNSSYLGGSSGEEGNGIAVDSTGNAYVTGYTLSQDFPTANPMQTTFGGGSSYGDAFITKISNSAPPMTLSLSAVQPDKGGNTGFVTVTLHGNGFANGATVKLAHAGQPEINAKSVTISHNSTIAEALFDLNGQAPGVRDVVLTNPDNSSATRAAAFTVESGGDPFVWVDLLGREGMRPGQPQTYYIYYGNRGNVDAYQVPLYIAFDKRMAWKRNFTIATPVLPAGVQPIDWTKTPITYEKDGLTYMPLRIIKIAPGGSGFLSLRLTLPEGWPRNENATVKVWAEPHPKRNVPPVVRAGTPPVKELVDPYLPASSHAQLPRSAEEQDDCRTSTARAGLAIGYTALGTITNGCLASSMSLWSGHELENSEGADSQVNSEIESTVAAAAWAGNCSGIPATPLDVLDIGLNIGSAIVDCTHVDQWLVHNILPIFGIDPNAKVGAQGVGAARYLSGEEPLRYVVYFENKPEAPGAAQTVVVTDQLDASKLDLDTFNLGPIFFGADSKVIPPSGLSEYSADVDLRPQQTLIAHVEARLNKTTGLLTWRFTSVDPATGLPTDDPTAGFLPPNRSAPEGEAQVLFTVMPKGGLATGTQIANKARIVFDANPFIDTPQWFNTIDNAKPVSQVVPLAANQCASFPVQWSGTDQGSGIASYSIFVSEIGGPFTIWQDHTTATSATFAGQQGKIYAFYSVAEDQTGNREDAPAVADATTMVNDSQPPTIACPGNMSVPATRPAGATVTYAATASDNCTALPIVSCSSPSGSTFAIGDKMVTCRATDAARNFSECAFKVHVKGAAQQVADLMAVIDTLNLKKKTDKKFDHKLDEVLKALDKGKTDEACKKLADLIKEAQKESGKKLAADEANQIIATANRIRAVLGC